MYVTYRISYGNCSPFVIHIKVIIFHRPANRIVTKSSSVFRGLQFRAKFRYRPIASSVIRLVDIIWFAWETMSRRNQKIQLDVLNIMKSYDASERSFNIDSGLMDSLAGEEQDLKHSESVRLLKVVFPKSTRVLMMQSSTSSCLISDSYAA